MNPILLHTLLWIMQGFLAVIFLIAGTAKLFLSPAKVAQLVPTAFPLPFLRVLGALEILGAVGVILPLVLDVLPMLTLAASCCMGIVLLAATVVHLKEKQFSKLPMLLVMLALAITVTVGRYSIIAQKKQDINRHSFRDNFIIKEYSNTEEGYLQKDSSTVSNTNSGSIALPQGITTSTEIGLYRYLVICT